METWQIVVLIFAIIFAAYLAGAFLVMGFCLTFRKKLVDRLQAVAIVQSERKRVLLYFFESLKKQGYSMTPVDTAILHNLEGFNTELVGELTANDSEKILRDAYKRIEYILAKDPSLSFSEQSVQGYADLLVNYRQCVNAYNYDLLGYNYWIKIPLIRLVPYLMGFRKKEKLN